ncbi:hypothetical protein CHS0354_022956 [Potamilus streckersoni]|uniref:Protein ZIP4 homolog n=1 Tax=Potamilus streckersoni TaxID=2493646 RepID=A0AAE0S585_9BIVA|nr:hypothetical protein CHS0354_022956 [Potamilus streckersoni]
MKLDNLSEAVATLTAILQDICRKEKTSSPEWHDQVQLADSITQTLQTLPQQHRNSSGSLTALENASVSLWNLSVSLKTKGVLAAQSNAKLRNIAFLIVQFCTETDNRDITLKKKIMMGLKTGRAWIDCNCPDMAEKVLIATEEYIKHLQMSILERKNKNPDNSADEEMQKLEAENELFKLLCYKAEIGLSQNRHEEALDAVLHAKEMLPKFPKEGAFLSMLCYNFGVNLFQSKQHENSIVWLRESYEIGKNKQAVGHKNQSRTLRLLANAYLEVNPEQNLQQALNAVSLANTEHVHPAGLYLRLKVLLLSIEPDEPVKKAIEDLLKLPDITVDLSLSILHLVNNHSRLEIVRWLIQGLLQKFGNSPDIGKILITNLEILVQGKQIKQAKEFMEFCITAHHTGRPLDLAIKKRFHLVLWEQGAAAFEENEFHESLDWYNYSLSLYSKSDTWDKNMAKLQRNRANCYLGLNQPQKAKEAIFEAEKIDPTSAHTQYIIYKLALLEENKEQASTAMQKMCDCARQELTVSGDEDHIFGLICLAAQKAFEDGNTSTSLIALECLCNSSPDPWQVLTALRCLVRLKLAEADEDEFKREEAFVVVENIRTAYNKLLQLQDQSTDRLPQIQKEAEWFMKIAWNLALQCDKHPEKMKDLFTLCSQLTSLCPVDDDTLVRQRTCMLMSAAACLQIARTTADEGRKRMALEESLDHVGNCKQLYGSAQTLALGPNDSKGKDTEKLLLLYEFEARTKLKDPRVENILERAFTMPNSDPKMFEALAALSMEASCSNKSLCVRVLKIAIRKNLQADQPDYSKCSQLFHSMVQLSLSSNNQDTTGQDEAWNYYMEILDILDKKAQGQYPEIEVLWLMTKAWNCGINLFSASKYIDAEKWCGLAIRMIKFLTTMKNNYQDHMNTVYGEVLAKIEGSKTRGSLEE